MLLPPPPHSSSNPTDPPRLPQDVTRRVLVAGAGLAGMSAALELAERGYEVIVRDASDIIGGRLATRRFPVPGLGGDGSAPEIFAIEHGFHAWFANYHQFADIRRRLGIDEHFTRW